MTWLLIGGFVLCVGGWNAAETWPEYIVSTALGQFCILEGLRLV